MNGGVVHLSTIFCAVRLLLPFIGGVTLLFLALPRTLAAARLRVPTLVALMEAVAIRAFLLA